MREFAKSQINMTKVKRGNLQWFDINHLTKKEKNLVAGGGSSRATTRGGDGFHARDAMPSAEGLGIYGSPSPLFAKLTKLQSSIAKPLDRCFLDCFFANT